MQYNKGLSSDRLLSYSIYGLAMMCIIQSMNHDWRHWYAVNTHIRVAYQNQKQYRSFSSSASQFGFVDVAEMDCIGNSLRPHALNTRTALGT
jgi:hypothetical protein